MNFADTKRLTNEGAKKMMATALASAKKQGIAVSIAIVDAGGHLLLLERMEGGRFHTVHSSTTKRLLPHRTSGQLRRRVRLARTWMWSTQSASHSPQDQSAGPQPVAVARS